MSRRFLLAGVLVVLAATATQAQVPFSRELMPTQAVLADGKPLTPLARVGLERSWFTAVPLFNQERLLLVSMAGNLIFAQTSESFLHAYEAESGRYLWTSHIGASALSALPVSLNSKQVFVTSGQTLTALNRHNGQTMWTIKLESMPSSATAADEERVTVGTITGKVATYYLKNLYPAFFWQSGGPVTSRPILAGPVIAFASQDARVYVAVQDPSKLIFRYLTAGPISANMGTYGTRTLLVPSEDNNVYAIDLFTADTRWSFTSGAPMEQEPLVANKEVFAMNNRGYLTSIDAESGAVHWTLSTGGGRLLAVTEKRVYLESPFRDLYIVDRETGNLVADAQSVRERAGLNVREFNITPTNSLTGRIYLASSSGMLICLRELGQIKPYLLRDPSAKPFGYVPRQGEAEPGAPASSAPTQEAAPPAEGGATPTTEDKAAGDKKPDAAPEG
ncbi:MAG TPA: PQQ-binding-like beta-propeller repeat protein [Isosphaeraceae bacterium]|jgi:outer membrane protein assembly factor BamB|nr:PQQ-binding-like beta-propeller repeat protein [Isosphaeraceae bacterium]